MKFDMSDFMAFLVQGGALLPQDRLILQLRAPGALTQRNEFWREVTIRARSRSKATEIKEAYFTCGRGESLLQTPSRASCGMFWVDSLTETQERACCVISVHIASALACTRLAYSLEPFVSRRKLKPPIRGHKAEITSPRWSAARHERAPAPGDGIEAEKGIGP